MGDCRFHAGQCATQEAAVKIGEGLELVYSGHGISINRGLICRTIGDPQKAITCVCIVIDFGWRFSLKS